MNKAILTEVLVRYGELALKSRPVRKFLEARLVRNIDRTLKNNNIHPDKFKVTNYRSWGRIIVRLHDWDSAPFGDYQDKELEEKVILILGHLVSGITSVSAAHKISSELEEILDVTVKFVSDRIQPSSSFAVRVKRNGKHPYSSNELAGKIGEKILDTIGKKKQLSVNLTNPDYTLYLEVRDQFAFIFDHREIGIGGFPQGSQGKIVSILRGSVEDAVAGFLLCKRGSISIPIIFEKKEKVRFPSNSSELKKQLELYSNFQPLKEHIHFKVDFDEILKAIGFNRLQCSTCDKVCIGVTERIIKNQHKDGITLGNSSEAILLRNPEKNLTSEFIPIYYPLIALDPKKLFHPFSNVMKNNFCLKDCPGFENQKKKEIEPLSPEELSDIVANANYAMVKNQ
ncbi:MAG: THUMP domain-containing protein [Candidatus Heimdallarchaeota archaeon]